MSRRVQTGKFSGDTEGRKYTAKSRQELIAPAGRKVFDYRFYGPKAGGLTPWGHNHSSTINSSRDGPTRVTMR
jgi:hypothetical protein